MPLAQAAILAFRTPLESCALGRLGPWAPGRLANGRCRIHGGTSTGPRTPEGLERVRMAHWKHGQRSAEAIRQRKERMALRREIKWLAGIADAIRSGGTEPCGR